jgi:hypothetical protein
MGIVLVSGYVAKDSVLETQLTSSSSEVSLRQLRESLALLSSDRGGSSLSSFDGREIEA